MEFVWKCAEALLSDGQYHEAKELFLQVMETRKRVLGDEHPDTLTSMNNLVFTLKSRGFMNKAIFLMEDYCNVGLAVFGPQHPIIVSSRKVLATWRLEALEAQKQKEL